MNLRWQLRPADRELVRRLGSHGALPEPVARLLVCRGHRDPAATACHMEASLQSLHDPERLPGIEAASQRLQRAIAEGETVLVHGDYDVDGVAGTALLVRLLGLCGARVAWHIPNRLTDGYSFGPHSLERARECGARVVLSVDNGTSAGETIAALAAEGIDTIVTDHHEPPEGELPPAFAIVNPKLPGSDYPFRELCGAGVAFKLAWGLCRAVSGARRVREDLRAFLQDAMAYVAMATVCDIVPLVDENRVLARRGLVALGASRSAGLRALLEVCGLAGTTPCGEDVAFQIGPRLNASGRLGSAETALALLLCDDERAARGLARELDRLNLERRRIEAELAEEAFREAERFADPARWPVLVLAGQGWHQGVVGIVAARVARRFGRPALVIGLDGRRGRGSARSGPGWDALELLRAGAAHMLRFGGHAQAAGCEVEAASVDELREAVCERARALCAERAPTEERLWIDCDLPLAQVDEALMRFLDRLEPFGQRNEKPVISSLGVRMAEPSRVIGRDGSHLSLRVRQGGRVHEAVGFGMAARADEIALGAPLHVVYTPRWNRFGEKGRLQLVLHDFKVGAEPLLAEA